MAVEASLSGVGGSRPLSTPVLVFSWLGAFVAIAVTVMVGVALSLGMAVLPVLMLAAPVVVLWCVQRPSRWVYLLVATMYLESYGLSLYVGGARVRVAQLLVFPAAAVAALQVVGGMMRVRRIPMFWPLVIYVGCNFISMALSPVPEQSRKVFVLLVVVVAIYCVAYTLVRDDPGAWPGILRFFVLVGLLEIGYGLYQVAAGFANVKFGLSLPIGELGLFQADYVGMFFGRPYGTMPEADTYGCICLFYALLLGLMWLTGSTPPVGRRLCEVTAVAALAGLLIGIVRAVWLGFLGGLLCALLLWLTGRMRGFRTMRVAGVGGTLALLVFVLLAGSPNAREVLLRRFSRTGSEAAFSRENVRFLQMQISWRLFREAPLLGNGPGCFSVLGGIGIPEHELYYASTRFDLSRMYDPSLMTTVLDDTGLVGAAAFLLLIASYLTRVHRRARSAVNAVARNAVLSAHCAVVGMFVSFLFTHYFWSPFTWLFLAVAMLVLEFGNGGVGPVQATTSPRSANHLSNHQEARECTCG